MSSDNAELQTGPEVRTTFMQLGRSARPVQYTIVDGRAQTEGCIILGSEQQAADSFELVLNTPGVLDPGKDTMGFGLVGEHYRWPNATIIFEIDGALLNTQRIDDAMQHWRDKVGVDFVQRQAGKAGHENFVRFVAGSGCSSAVGMRSGMQELVLGAGCSKGNCIHELGHAFGLWHEQSRIDRDIHVRIRFERIQSGREFNFFQRLHDGFNIGKYDPGSMMHYPLDAFAIGDEPTIELLAPFDGEVGQRKGLSDGDVASIKQMYGL